MALQALHLASEGNIHDPLDTLLQADPVLIAHPEALGARPAPLPHRGDKKRRHGIGRPFVDPVVKVIQGTTGPERLLELFGQAAKPAHLQCLFEDDRPGPDRGDEQHDHHDLHDDIGL